jgi:hypothetical protein
MQNTLTIAILKVKHRNSFEELFRLYNVVLKPELIPIMIGNILIISGQGF